MKTDAQLKMDVMSELAWDPSINATGIGVIVKDGIVTLTGHLDSFAEKHAAERAARRVAGVRGIVVELDVKIAARHARSDSEIAQAAIDALRWHSRVPEGRLTVEVEHGWVTLSGQVDWHYQRSAAEECIRPLMGVRGLTNNVTVRPHASGSDISAEISAALTRQAQRDAGHIKVDVDVEGGGVTLTGNVRSMREHDAAVGTAWSAAGVRRVIDKLVVET